MCAEKYAQIPRAKERLLGIPPQVIHNFVARYPHYYHSPGRMAGRDESDVAGWVNRKYKQVHALIFSLLFQSYLSH